MPHSSKPVAVITGASSGIGAQFARRYAREGYDLVLVARSAAALRVLADELAEENGITARVHAADLTKAVDVAALATELTEGLPRLDHLVNSAGSAPEGDLADTDESALRQVVELNVMALMRIFAVSPGDTDTGMGSNSSTNKRRPGQVVDTAWRAMRSTAPSVVDGVANSILAVLSSRVFPKRLGLRIAERMMRRMM